MEFTRRVRSLLMAGEPSNLGRQQLAVLLISFGLSLLLFTAAAYSWMFVEQRRLLKPRVVTAENGAVPIDNRTLLSIPKIGLQAAVLDGSKKSTLLAGPGHLERTVQPGEHGNSVIAAHRDTFFRKINELNRGDDIFVDRGARRFHYVVTKKFIVNPKDVSVMAPSTEPLLTLVTCYPTYFIGPAPKRLIVAATLVTDHPGNGGPDRQSVRTALQ